MIWQEEGDYTEAKLQFKQAIETQSSFSGHFRLRYARCCFECGDDYDTTLAFYQEAISHEATPEAYLSLVEFFVAHGSPSAWINWTNSPEKFQEASKELQQIAVDPGEPMSWFNTQIYKG